MLCIICLFFRLGRVDEEVPTRERVDWETWDTCVLSQQVIAAERGLDVLPQKLVLARVTHFAHDLSPIEHDLVPFAKAVFWRLLSF